MDAKDKGPYAPRSYGRSVVGLYNGRRPHSSLDGITPDQAYFTPLPLRLAAYPGRGSTYRRGKSVQTTGTTSLLRAALELRARKSRRRRCHCENRPARSARCRMRPCKAASSVRLDMFGRGWSLAEELRKLLGFVRALAPPSKEADRGKQKAK